MATLASAFTYEFYQLVLCRFLLGVGQAVVNPCVFSITSDLFAEDRAFFLSFFTSMIYTGNSFFFFEYKNFASFLFVNMHFRNIFVGYLSLFVEGCKFLSIFNSLLVWGCKSFVYFQLLLSIFGSSVLIYFKKSPFIPLFLTPSLSNLLFPFPSPLSFFPPPSPFPSFLTTRSSIWFRVWGSLSSY